MRPLRSNRNALYDFLIAVVIVSAMASLAYRFFVPTIVVVETRYIDSRR